MLAVRRLETFTSTSESTRVASLADNMSLGSSLLSNMGLNSLVGGEASVVGRPANQPELTGSFAR